MTEHSSTIPTGTGLAEQIEAAYRKMAGEARYRPVAPSDGFGNITVPLEALDLDAEAAEYADSWWREEDDLHFFVGCCNWPTRPATIFAIEAARAMCGAQDQTAARLMRLALNELEAM